MVSLVGTFLGRPLLRWRAVIDGCRGFCVARRIGSGWINVGCYRPIPVSNVPKVVGPKRTALRRLLTCRDW